MRIEILFVKSLLFCLLSLPAFGAELEPLSQGLHEWPALKGKLYAVVGSYQDVVTYRRSYNFFFKYGSVDTWHQVPVVDKKGVQDFTWYSSTHGEVTLADAVVLPRRNGVYFVEAIKRVQQGYYDPGTITVTWYKLTNLEIDEDSIGELPYQFKPVFTRSYPNSKLTVEAILGKESELRPAR